MTPQPISTAPKGQRILLYCKRPIESEGWWQIGMMCLDVRRWIDDDYEPDWLLVQPTYWLPLPPQPTQPVAEDSSVTSAVRESFTTA